MTEQALLEALRAHVATEDSGEGMTTAEIVETSGLSLEVVRKLIRRALQDGRVRRTVRVMERIDGKRTPVTGYALTEPAKKKGRRG